MFDLATALPDSALCNKRVDLDSTELTKALWDVIGDGGLITVDITDDQFPEVPRKNFDICKTILATTGGERTLNRLFNGQHPLYDVSKPGPVAYPGSSRTSDQYALYLEAMGL